MARTESPPECSLSQVKLAPAAASSTVRSPPNKRRPARSATGPRRRRAWLRRRRRCARATGARSVVLDGDGDPAGVRRHGDGDGRRRRHRVLAHGVVQQVVQGELQVHGIGMAMQLRLFVPQAQIERHLGQTLPVPLDHRAHHRQRIEVAGGGQGRTQRPRRRPPGPGWCGPCAAGRRAGGVQRATGQFVVAAPVSAHRRRFRRIWAALSGGACRSGARLQRAAVQASSRRAAPPSSGCSAAPTARARGHPPDGAVMRGQEGPQQVAPAAAAQAVQAAALAQVTAVRPAPSGGTAAPAGRAKRRCARDQALAGIAAIWRTSGSLPDPRPRPPPAARVKSATRPGVAAPPKPRASSDRSRAADPRPASGSMCPRDRVP